ncbi:MAG: hypothetical protein ACKVH8_03400 [Pirellulales bacterium]
MRQFLSESSRAILNYVGRMESTDWTYVFIAVVLFGFFCLKSSNHRSSV